MSIMGGAFLQGMGSGIAGIGALAMKYQQELDELALKRETILEKLKMEYGLKADAANAKAARIEDRRKGFMSELGVEEMTRPETDAEFSTEVADESGGHTGVDSKKYDSYKRRQQEGSVMARMLAESDDPKQSQEAISEWRKRQLTLDAEDMPSALEGGRRIGQYKGQGEYGIEGDTKLNKHTGATETTELGRAKIGRERTGAAENAAQARAADALASERIADAERKARTGGMTASEIYKQLVDLNQEETRVNTRLKEFQYDDEIAADERENLRRIQALRKELRGELAKLRQSGGKGGNDKAPYPDGTRLRGKDGKMYIVRNGKPVLEGK